ncbi:PLP-dependent cysteine synthase family protein [Lentzea albidocapillata]|uniref:Cysteine synthase A n=1 Tax=Lentzea albidocapillata TaxID=40571 RepID=A0A1W2FUD5_9PSEU|nr:PLP-dependent cysteine synthase family protein [Lentzea albidocapillata]SMD25530.1 cysteine synthase A [Lentzea albidocapillata]
MLVTQSQPSTLAVPPARMLTSSSAPLCHTPASVVGNTPVQWIDDLSGLSPHGFWAKLEGFNPGGMKDRPALHMVAKARERGELAPGGTIVESTSGTLGLGLALAGIVYGHPVTLVTDPGMEPIVQQMLQAHGAQVDLVPAPHPTGGWQQARRDRVEQILAETPGSYCPDQYSNPDNVAGYESLALELVAQLGRVDVLVCSVGTGGHSAGVSRVLREYFPHLRLVGVDTIGSTIFGQPARPRLMRGLGSSIFPRNVDYPAFDEVHWVNPAESVWACRTLASRHHASGGWSVGAVAVVSSWLARTHDPDVRVAAVFPDGPQRYFDTIYNDTYCAANELLVTAPSPDPEEILATSDREVTGWTRCRSVADPTRHQS